MIDDLEEKYCLAEYDTFWVYDFHMATCEHCRTHRERCEDGNKLREAWTRALSEYHDHMSRNGIGRYRTSGDASDSKAI